MSHMCIHLLHYYCGGVLKGWDELIPPRNLDVVFTYHMVL